MSRLELFADIIDGRLHVAVLEKTILQNLYVDSVTPVASWASIYLGKVVKVDKRLNAAIIDLGNGLQGLLAAKNMLSPVSAGQMIPVQIKAEAKSASPLENHKMPRLTMKLHMMGHCMHHMPLSGDILNAEYAPDIAKQLNGKGGWIFRAPAKKMPKDKIEAEALSLLKSWQDIKAAAIAGQPMLLKKGPNAIQNALSDYGLPSFDHINAGNKEVLNLVMDWSDLFDASLSGSKRLRLFKPEKPQQKLFDIYDLYAILDELKDSVVPLASGGTLVIEPTTALTIIDINQGNSDSILTCNLDAATEIARQIRLRNMSGAILVDFINLPLKSERLQLLDKMTQALSADPVKNQCHGFTRLGIIEITRKRRDAAYEEK